MNSNQYQEDSFINSIIGEGTHLRGDFDLNGLLRVDGDFSGTVKTRGKVLIGSNGRAECTIYGGTVVVGGAVKGNIFATEKVIILSTGMMIGNIRAPKLIMEEGVLFDGTCRIETVPVKSEELFLNQSKQAERASSLLKQNAQGPGGILEKDITGNRNKEKTFSLK